MGLLSREGVVEVAVGAERPAVVLDQGRDQTGFVVFIKPHWTGVRRLFWTGITCCRHRYAGFETPAIGSFWHCQGPKRTVVWPMELVQTTSKV